MMIPCQFCPSDQRYYDDVGGDNTLKENEEENDDFNEEEEEDEGVEGDGAIDNNKDDGYDDDNNDIGHRAGDGFGQHRLNHNGNDFAHLPAFNALPKHKVLNMHQNNNHNLNHISNNLDEGDRGRWPNADDRDEDYPRGAAVPKDGVY